MKNAAASTPASAADLDGLKLIRHNAGGVDASDDPSYPYRLEINLRPPDFMQVTFIMKFGGSETLVIRGMSREVIERFIEMNGLLQHPRLRSAKLTGPDIEIDLR